MKKLLFVFLAIITMVTYSLALTACAKATTVTFVVDGTTYCTVKVKSEEEFSFPEEPIKTNYTFEGWYLDYGVWEQPFNEQMGVVESITENLTVYARFLLNTIEGVTFDDATFDFDGNEKSIVVNNLPEGANVNYSPSNVQTDAGTYEITATISKENYQDKVLTATLVINEAMMNVTFEDKKVLLGASATIKATGYPDGATVTYTNAGPYSEKGSYTIGVKIEKANYVTFEKTATLSIVEAKDLITAKNLAGKTSGSGYPTTYYLCVVEFNEDYTKANLYATKYNTKGKETDYISNTNVDIGFTNEGKLRITAQWVNDYNWIRLVEDGYGGFRVTDCSSNSSYWDHYVVEGFGKKPTLTGYTGKYELDLSSYEEGQTFAPTGWTEQVMNADTGEYEASSGNAQIVVNNGEKRIAVTLGANENNVYKYTYMFSETPLGEFSFYKFNYKNSAYVRVKFLTATGGNIYVIGSKTAFFTANATTNLDQFDWLYGYGDQIGNIVGVEIEVYAKANAYNPNNTIEIIPFILSYGLEI